MAAAVKITVIGSRLAKPGGEFFFMQEMEECKKCQIRGTCLNLEPGRKYVIQSVKNANLLSCALHDEGVLAVVVKNAPVEAYVDSKKAVSGSKIVYEPVFVRKNSAENGDDEDGGLDYALFSPKGLEKGDKCVVADVFEGFELDGKTYKRVYLVLES
ncbi:hypothetical protein MsAg5_00620 [Methanosarcinaceae archaeon Ag5]|uniref:UPF0179 protein MsAg5_00620 n=1 Tax=Methanolapillus africanus TaxID=3028297 RepID=A0AAE4MHG2_9EURY|nr:hypothetical protein [Methanosarcinaceae archaeon Ag5]